MIVKRLAKIALAAAVWVLPVASAQAVPVFTNGSFESGTTGWTFSGGSFVTSGGFGYDGGAWAWVGRRDAPSALISQTVSGFTVGATYELSFLLGTESFVYNGGLGDTVNVAILGAGTIGQDFTQSNGSGSGWNMWEEQTYSFVADASSLTFQIHGYADGAFGHNSADAGVDRFALSELVAVPAPGALALLPACLVLMRHVGRRRRRTT